MKSLSQTLLLVISLALIGGCGKRVSNPLLSGNSNGNHSFVVCNQSTRLQSGASVPLLGSFDAYVIPGGQGDFTLSLIPTTVPNGVVVKVALLSTKDPANMRYRYLTQHTSLANNLEYTFHIMTNDLQNYEYVYIKAIPSSGATTSLFQERLTMDTWCPLVPPGDAFTSLNF